MTLPKFPLFFGLPAGRPSIAVERRQFSLRSHTQDILNISAPPALLPRDQVPQDAEDEVRPGEAGELRQGGGARHGGGGEERVSAVPARPIGVPAQLRRVHGRRRGKRRWGSRHRTWARSRRRGGISSKQRPSLFISIFYPIRRRAFLLPQGCVVLCGSDVNNLLPRKERDFPLGPKATIC